MNLQTMSTGEFVVEARRLRSEWFAAEERFFGFLYEAESYDHLWKDTALTYEMFLEKSNICKAIRYQRYKLVRDNHGARTQTVGIHAVMGASNFQSAEHQRQILDESEAYTASNGATPPDQTVKHMVRDLRSRIAHQASGHLSYGSLMAENGRLRNENVRLKETVRLLQEEISAMRSKLSEVST